MVDITRPHLPAGIPKKEFQLFATVKHILIINTCFCAFSGGKVLSFVQHRQWSARDKIRRHLDIENLKRTSSLRN
jgi:hypothetical protein